MLNIIERKHLKIFSKSGLCIQKQKKKKKRKERKKKKGKKREREKQRERAKSVGHIIHEKIFAVEVRG